MFSCSGARNRSCQDNGNGKDVDVCLEYIHKNIRYIIHASHMDIHASKPLNLFEDLCAFSNTTILRHDSAWDSLDVIHADVKWIHPPTLVHRG